MNQMSVIKTSARNQFKGKIAKVTLGAVNAEVILNVDGQDIVAIITNESAQNLGLKEGDEAYALIKASMVILAAADSGLKVSARNALAGTVKKIEKGAVNSEVVVALAGGQEIVAIITNHSVENLDLKDGGPVTALIKASQVIVAVAA